MNLSVGRSALLSSDSYGLNMSASNRDFSEVKIETFIGFFLYLSYFFLKQEQKKTKKKKTKKKKKKKKKKKIGIPLQNPVSLYKNGV